RPKIELAACCGRGRIRGVDDAIVLPPLCLVNPPATDADVALFAIVTDEGFLWVRMERAKIGDGGVLWNFAAWIEGTLFWRGDPGLSPHVYDRVPPVHSS